MLFNNGIYFRFVTFTHAHLNTDKAITSMVIDEVQSFLKDERVISFINQIIDYREP